MIRVMIHTFKIVIVNNLESLLERPLVASAISVAPLMVYKQIQETKEYYRERMEEPKIRQRVLERRVRRNSSLRRDYIGDGKV